MENFEIKDVLVKQLNLLEKVRDSLAKTIKKRAEEKNSPEQKLISACFLEASLAIEHAKKAIKVIK